MEIIGRFPVVALDEPGCKPPATTDCVAAQPRGQVVEPRRARRFTGRPGNKPPVAFPIRSVAVLAVLTAAVWGLALRNDAARRHPAAGSQGVTLASDPREAIAK